MKKTFLPQILAILIFSFTSTLKGNETIVKGTVHKWPTDTVYICELPFHSPYSSSVEYQVISSDSTFRFKFTGKDKLSVFLIGPEKHPLDLKIKSLLFDNLTSRHYYGHCIKVYTVGVSTFLIKPGTTFEIELNFNSWIEQLSPKRAEMLKRMGIPVADDNTVRDYGTTGIVFFGPNQFSNKYYQKSFNLDDKLDKLLERIGNINSAIKKLEIRKQNLLSDLDLNKGSLDAMFYEYLKAEIEFGARKEFLKYLRFEHEDYLKTLFTGEIPKDINEIVEFDKNNITNAILINEEYNEYLELYMNFKMNENQQAYLAYNVFNKDKYELALKELPEISQYYYLANNLLHTDSKQKFIDLYHDIIMRYPNGELNIKLKEKYDKE